MIHRMLFILLMWLSVVLLAACGPAQSTSTPVSNMPNPAAVYCEQHGGKSEIVTAADGSQSGLCIFPDGSTCDEWAYFRGECRSGDSVVTPEPTVPLKPVSSLTPTTAPATPSPVPTLRPTTLRVAYFGGGQIRLWIEGKGSRPLGDATSVEQVRISDDGQMIAYASRYSHGGYEILGVNADGTHQHVLVGWDYLKDFQPIDSQVFFDFAPASHTLYFVTDQYDLHRVNADSGAPAPVFGPGQGGFFSFSPNGQWMVLSHPEELILARPDGTNARVVYKNPPDSGYVLVRPDVIWEPDSTGFHIVSASGPPQDNPDNMTVWFIPLAGEPVRQMSYTGPYGANLSPDGRTVVYLYHQHEPTDVHVVSADGKDTIFDSYASSPGNLGFMGWAPDSKHFLLDLSEDGRFQVPYLCAIGEQSVKLTDTDDAHAVVWIDEQRLLFASHGKTLHLQRFGAPSTLLDDNASSWFDYAFANS